MDTMHICLLLPVLLFVIFIKGILSQGQEFCHLDTFSPVCLNHQVIVITEAHYGRMRIGKCVLTDFGFVGCKNDVLQQADSICSGKFTCSLPIPNRELDQIQSTCPKDLGRYLEINYRCQTVYIPKRQKCHSPETVPIGKPDGYISSIVTQNTLCGVDNSPWKLEAKPGQKILIDLLDFDWQNNSKESHQCPVKYGYILDTHTDNVIEICGSRERETRVYNSTGHIIQITLQKEVIDKSDFLLKYKAIGCPNFTPPNHSWTKQENDSIKIGCVSSADTWKVKCVDNMWLGAVGDCPQATTTETGVTVTPVEDDKRGKGNILPHVTNNHVMAFAFGCMTLIICCTIIILGIYCSKRYEAKINKYRSDLAPVLVDNQATIDRAMTLYTPVHSEVAMNTMNHSTMLPPYTSLRRDNDVHTALVHPHITGAHSVMLPPPTNKQTIEEDPLVNTNPKVFVDSDTPPAIPTRPPSCRGMASLGQVNPLQDGY